MIIVVKIIVKWPSDASFGNCSTVIETLFYSYDST